MAFGKGHGQVSDNNLCSLALRSRCALWNTVWFHRHVPCSFVAGPSVFWLYLTLVHYKMCSIIYFIMEYLFNCP